MYTESSSLWRALLVLGIIFLIMGLNPEGHQNSLFAQTKGSEVRPTQQESWKPAGPMTLIVGAGSGTAYDFLARQIAQVLPDYLGKPVIVNISPGGGGGIALDMLQMAKPDGRTFALYGVGTQINLTLSRLYKWDIKDLNLILAIEAPPYAVCSSLKHSKIKDFKDLMKAREEVRIATPGPNFAVVPLILQLERNGIKYKAARFKGMAEAYLAVIAGDADISIGALSSVTLDPIRAGDFQPLFIFANKRSPDLPNTPTVVELGMPREWANYNLIRLIALPPGVPAEIQNALTEALMKTLQDKRTLEWSKKTEIPLSIVPRKDLEEQIRFIVEEFRNNIEIAKRYFL